MRRLRRSQDFLDVEKVGGPVATVIDDQPVEARLDRDATSPPEAPVVPVEATEDVSGVDDAEICNDPVKLRAKAQELQARAEEHVATEEAEAEADRARRSRRPKPSQPHGALKPTSSLRLPPDRRRSSPISSPQPKPEPNTNRRSQHEREQWRPSKGQPQNAMTTWLGSPRLASVKGGRGHIMPVSWRRGLRGTRLMPRA